MPPSGKIPRLPVHASEGMPSRERVDELIRHGARVHALKALVEAECTKQAMDPLLAALTAADQLSKEFLLDLAGRAAYSRTVRTLLEQCAARIEKPAPARVGTVFVPLVIDQCDAVAGALVVPCRVSWSGAAPGSPSVATATNRWAEGLRRVRAIVARETIGKPQSAANVRDAATGWQEDYFPAIEHHIDPATAFTLRDDRSYELGAAMALLSEAFGVPIRIDAAATGELANDGRILALSSHDGPEQDESPIAIKCSLIMDEHPALELFYAAPGDAEVARAVFTRRKARVEVIEVRDLEDVVHALGIMPERFRGRLRPRMLERVSRLTQQCGSLGLPPIDDFRRLLVADRGVGRQFMARLGIEIGLVNLLLILSCLSLVPSTENLADPRDLRFHPQAVALHEYQAIKLTVSGAVDQLVSTAFAGVMAPLLFLAIAMNFVLSRNSDAVKVAKHHYSMGKYKSFRQIYMAGLPVLSVLAFTAAVLPFGRVYSVAAERGLLLVLCCILALFVLAERVLAEMSWASLDEWLYEREAKPSLYTEIRKQMGPSARIEAQEVPSRPLVPHGLQILTPDWFRRLALWLRAYGFETFSARRAIRMIKQDRSHAVWDDIVGFFPSLFEEIELRRGLLILRDRSLVSAHFREQATRVVLALVLPWGFSGALLPTDVWVTCWALFAAIYTLLALMAMAPFDLGVAYCLAALRRWMLVGIFSVIVIGSPAWLAYAAGRISVFFASLLLFEVFLAFIVWVVLGSFVFAKWFEVYLKRYSRWMSESPLIRDRAGSSTDE